jgi:hypothetical protein
MSNATVSARKFAAAYVTVSTEETRYYLCGVFIEPCPHGGVFLVSTDGHRLTVIHDPDGTTDEPTVRNVPKEILTAAKKPGNFDNPIIFKGDSVTLADMTVIAPPTTGTYPDWRRVVPDVPTEAKCGAFNAAYLGDYAKIARILTGVRSGVVSIQPSPTNAAAIITLNGSPEFYGALMPMRSAVPDAAPEWMAPATKQAA